MDAKQIATEYPEAAQELRAEGKKQVQQETEEEVKKAKAEILELARATLGEEPAAQLDKVLQSGLSVEQIKQARELFGSLREPSKPEGEDEKQRILDGLKQAHGHQGLGQGGAGGNDTRKVLTDSAQARNKHQ